MIDVVPSVNLDQQRLDFPHDPFQPQYFNNTPATFATQPILNNPTSYGFDLTGEMSIEVARPNFFDLQNWSAASLIAMTFHQQFPQFPQFYHQLSDQNQSHTTTSSQQQTSNDMSTSNGFTGQQQYPDVDNNSSQQSPILQQPPLESSPPYVEPSVNNYSCFPTTSSCTTSNSMSLTNNNLDNNPTNNNNYPSRNVYVGNYPQQPPYLEHNYHNCPTSHPSRIGMTNPQLINYPIRQRIIYQGPTSPSSIGRKIIPSPIDTNVPNVSNVSYSRPENVTTASLPTTTIAPTNLNLFTFSHPGNALVPSSFDLSSNMFTTTKPTTIPSTIAIPPNSTGSIASSSESESPIKKYSYGGPPKSYYSRLPLYDRPFKCDTCPQSFNRNHDLKRHKRIHLAVKPYPCPYCEKQFSRKDALKRHILVKGCNNTNKKNNNNSNNKSADNDSLTNSGQKYDSIESESPIKSEPTSDNNVQNFI